MTRPSFRSLRVAVAILGAAALLIASPAAASWSQALNTPSLNLPQGGVLNFDLIVTHTVGSPDNTIAVTVTTSKIGGSGVTGTGAGPTLITDANSPVTIPLSLAATASATLGSWSVSVRSVEGISTRTSNFTINVIAGSSSSAPVISGVSATSTVNSITVTWNTDIAANQRLFWGTNSCPDLAVPCTYNGTPVANTSTYTTSHLMSVSGLLPDTLYYFRVVSCSISNLCSTSNEGSIRTALATGDTTPPTISNILISAGDIRATVTWNTDENADSLVEYGLSTTYGSQVADGTLTQSHTVNLTGLTPLTRYYYRITSRDSSGNSANTGVDPNKFFETVALGQVDRIFTTGACTDSSGNAVPIGRCTVGTPSEYCHSGGILALDCNYCGYTCNAGQTCRADGTCADNPSANPNNPYQCNDAKCYDVSGVFISPSPFADCYSTYPKCNANSILKVRPDRICTQWLTPKTSVTLTNPQTKQQEQLSLSLTACTSLDSAGRCATVAEGNHCRLSPLTLCNTDGDCDTGDKCVPATHCNERPYTDACSADSDCSPGVACVSDNLTFFNPRDRFKFGFLTGSIQPGLTWGGGYCSVDQGVACGRDSDCPARNPPQSCNFDPTYGRCANDATKACTVNNADTVCGKTCSNNVLQACTADIDCGAGNVCAGQCTIQAIGGRYPWELNHEVGVAVPQLDNSGFEEIERVEQAGKTVVQFPASPWQALSGSDIRVEVDPSLVGTTTASSNHVLKVSPSTTRGSGAEAPSDGFSLSPGQRYYVSLRIRANGSQRVQVTLGISSNIEPIDLTDSWVEKLLSFKPTSGSGGSKLSVTCLPKPGETECATNTFFLDDVSIQTALNVATVATDEDHPDGRLFIPRTCRLYPQEDSLVCDYTSSGVRYLGQHGYCLQRDPQNSSTCVSWWPVDIIAGDGDFFGTQGKIGYSDRTPLYLCTESRGFSNGGVSGGGSNYLSGTVMNWTVVSTDTRAMAVCDPSNAAYAFDDRGYGLTDNGTFPVLADPYTPTNAYPGQGCIDVGSKLGGVAGRDDFDIYQEDLASIQIITNRQADPAGYPRDGTAFFLTPDNNWSFLWCANQTNCAPGTTFDDAEKAGWLNLGNVNNNEIGAKAEFSDSGLLTGIRFRMNDASADTGGIQMLVSFMYKEMCTTLVKVADSGVTVPWASRLAARGYAVPDLLYKYTKDFAPYGSAVNPSADAPNTWFTKLNAEAPITDDTQFSAPQYQSRSGSPFACKGGCDVKVCIGGGRPGQLCGNNPTLCREEAVRGDPTSKGVCQGVQSSATAKGPQSYSNTPTNTNPFYAELRAQRLFAQSLGVFRWQHVCSNFTTKFCVSDTDCDLGSGNTGQCQGTYLSSASGGWTPPENRCANDPRPAAFDPENQTDYCGIPPTVGNVKVNGSTIDTEIRSSGFVTLTFTTTADAEQVPIQHIKVDWGEGRAPEALDKTLAPQPDPANPMVFTHTYTCAQGTCTYTPHIRVLDNWGWGSNPGAANRADSANDNKTDWVAAPTITVTSN